MIKPFFSPTDELEPGFIKSKRLIDSLFVPGSERFYKVIKKITRGKDHMFCMICRKNVLSAQMGSHFALHFEDDSFFMNEQWMKTMIEAPKNE